MHRPSIKVERVSPQATFRKMHVDDVCYDLTLCAWERVGTYGMFIFNWGIRIEPPSRDYYFKIHARSSLFKLNLQLANGVGIIDSGYRGVWMSPIAIVHGAGYVDPDELIGQRLAQAEICTRLEHSIEFVPTINKDTERGVAGFGSTGENNES